MSASANKRYGRVVGRRFYELTARCLEAKGTICALCGQPGATVADHIVPISRGGDPADLANLQPAHKQCNGSRHNKTMAEWYADHPLPTRPALPPSREW